MIGLDTERDLVCPLVRTSRLLNHSCTKHIGASACQLPNYLAKGLAVILNDAKSRDICTKERRAPVETLHFTPLPMPDFG